jgi:hypothetical protein
MRGRNYLLITFFFCAFTAGVFAGDIYAAGKEPDWVTDYNSVYPESQWICVVESAKDKAAATASAQNSLASIFKLDIKTLSRTVRSMTQSRTDRTVSYAENNSIGGEVTASAEISGLMGVVSDSWAAKDGTVYVLLRMNRKDSAAVYSSIINENCSVINDYIDDAKKKKAEFGATTFESYAELNSAANLALLNNNYLNILSILNPAARNALNISYENTARVKKLAEESARAIVITINISGDDGGRIYGSRIKKSFVQVFTQRGFKTTEISEDASAKNTYTLSCNFSVGEVVFSDNPNKFARYELQASLLDFSGNEIFSYSSVNREGHPNYSEATERALRSAEKSIINIEDEESFASVFNTYLFGQQR